MYFQFGVDKLIQAVGVLLRSEADRRMGYLRLLKLLYIADREALEERGRPIVGTRPVAMDYGPVHSEVLDLVNGQHWAEQRWSAFIRKDGYEIELTDDPGVLSLSRYEIAKLNEISARYRELDQWELANLTHEFPEWKAHHVPGSSSDIPLEDILAAVNRSDDQDEILREAEETHALNRLLGMTS